VPKEQLAAAINKVGVSADAVARELGKAIAFSHGGRQENL
jgi:hypothetical protein